ncbi:MAG: PPK2 family polyphosphate kinase [Cytophagales bacterium]
MKKYDLANISTKAPKELDKEEYKKKTEKILAKLPELQDKLYAQGTYSLLIILQGVDASGKDGAVKAVFKGVNPSGCSVTSWKAPTELERKHDFLWRIHKEVPEKGMIKVFNRSHYEDVLITRVEKWIDDAESQKRFTHINNFEKLISEANHTIILKFYLHISKEEQLERLQERIDDPTKNWKYNANDLKVNEKWDEYRKVYENAFESCSDIPWVIVPADQNWYKEYLISKTIVETLENLKLEYPLLAKEDTK